MVILVTYTNYKITHEKLPYRPGRISNTVGEVPNTKESGSRSCRVGLP